MRDWSLIFKKWLSGSLLIICSLHADQTSVAASKPISRELGDVVRRVQLIQQQTIHDLTALIQETPTKNLPAITEVLQRAVREQQALGLTPEHDEKNWLEFFENTFQQELLLTTTRAARPTSAETTGLSSQLPAMDQAIVTAVNNAIEFINRQGSWSVNRLTIRDKLMGNFTISGTISIENLNVAGNFSVGTDKFTVSGATGTTTLKGDHANLILQDGTGTTTCIIESATGNICSIGQIASTQATCSVSDQRIKTDVDSLNPQHSLQTVTRLRPVSFFFTREWLKKNKLKKEKQLGLIAQEVKQEIPEAVSQTTFPSGEQLYTVAYEKIIPHLISCIQELNNKIDTLDKKLANFEQQRVR